MGSFGVEPDQIINHPFVELVCILEEMGIPVNELFLDRSIEPFAVGVHLRGPWIGIPMDQGFFFKLFLKRFHELRSIVGQHMLNSVWEALEDGLEDMGCFLGGMALCPIRKGKA